MALFSTLHPDDYGTILATRYNQYQILDLIMLLQSQNHALRPLTTAHLAQTMTLLELTGDELRQRIESALSSNPALELSEEFRCPQCHRLLPRVGPCPTCSSSRQANEENPIVFVSPRQDFAPAGKSSLDDSPAEEWMAEVEELPVFVLRQVAPELDPQDRQIAAHILTSLDEDGLLSVTLYEIARYHHVSLERVEKIQRLIQRAEPVGVGSSNPQQALLVQLEVLAETRSVPQLAFRAVQEGMELLSRRSYVELGRLLNISANQASQVASFITDNLNPFPARAHWGDIHQAPEPGRRYQTPDIVISRLHDTQDTPLIVEIISPFAGALRVNPLFRQSLTQAPADKTEAWQADLNQADLLVKCLQQRNQTLVRLMQRLVVLQRQYILEGDACLAPLTRAQLADELKVHESTISRAVAGKAVQLPNLKVVPLSKWFDRSLNVRTALMHIISQEAQPLSDTEIAERLAKQGFVVARRTVAKYRSMEGILPARLRQSHAVLA
jgi:RNA polymerase sigma-54 factor